MAQIGTCWDQASWAVPAWAANTWSGAVISVVTPSTGGGRRIKKREYRPLNKRERAEFERMLQRNVKPRYVAPPEPVEVRKRTAPIVITLPPDEPRAITKPAERVVAAKQFLALDAIESLLDALPVPAVAERQAHLRAQQHAQRLAAEQERIALAREGERAELARIAEELEAQRIAEEEELMMVLLLVHDGIGA